MKGEPIKVGNVRIQKLNELSLKSKGSTRVGSDTTPESLHYDTVMHKLCSLFL